MKMMMEISQLLRYWLANHPAIVNFRWSHAQSFGSTWIFLLSSLSLYLLLSLLLHSLLSLLLGNGKQQKPVPLPLGPLPALHSLLMSVSSAVIFLGLLLSSIEEIGDSLWLFRGRTSTTPLRWLLCFPLGTRPSGRVFFWSYLFYLSRYLHALRTFFSILRRRAHALSSVFTHAALLAMSFLWLEFSQSFQVLAILSATLAHVVVFGYRFWVAVGLPVAGRHGPGGNCFPVVLACQVALLGCNLVCHLGVLLLHFWRGGCNGIGAWVFNSVLNAALLLLFVNCQVRRAVMKRRGVVFEEEDCGSHHYSSHRRNRSSALIIKDKDQ